jgi:hypothetical protein
MNDPIVFQVFLIIFDNIILLDRVTTVRCQNASTFLKAKYVNTDSNVLSIRSIFHSLPHRPASNKHKNNFFFHYLKR